MTRVLWLTLSGVLLVGCTSRRSAHNAELYTLASTRWQRIHVAAADTCETKPWAVGQWALYQTTSHGSIVGFDRIRVVERDWLEWIEDTAGARTTWLVQIREERGDRGGQRRVAMILRSAGGDPELWELERGSHVPSRLVEALGAIAPRLELHLRQMFADCGVETIDVPAGHFEKAARTRHDAFDAWSHPSVPLGGVVKLSSPLAAFERMLVAHGDADPMRLRSDINTVIWRARQRCPANALACELSVHAFVSLGFGIGRWTEEPGVATRGGPMATLQLGQRLVPGLHVVEEVVWTYGGNTELDESHIAVQLGLRWTPFRRGRRVSHSRISITPFRITDLDAVHFRLSGGAVHRSRNRYAMDERDSAWLPAATGALGWLPLQGQAWAFGGEFRYQTQRASDGWQREWTFGGLLQVSN